MTTREIEMLKADYAKKVERVQEIQKELRALLNECINLVNDYPCREMAYDYARDTREIVYKRVDTLQWYLEELAEYGKDSKCEFHGD